MQENQELSLFPGLSRRDFLKSCGALAAVIGLSGPMAAPRVAEAMQGLAKRPRVIWSLFQECLGCSVNLLQSRRPTPAQLILQQISLDYHEAVMAAAGDEAEKSFRDTVDSGEDFYYIVEGSIATTPPEAITIHGKTAADICLDTYKKAKATIAIGNCACYGNVQAAKPNPTGAMGVGDYLSKFVGLSEVKVINSPRCPGQAEDTLAILAYVMVHGTLPELDSVGRPLFLFGQTVHDNCERRGHFDAGEFVEHFGDEASRNRWCFYKVGCKGPVTYAPCPVNKWNGEIGWPVHAGPCIGCAEPDFWDKFSPFYDKAPGFRLPGDITPTQIGVGLGAAAAIGIGAHFMGQAASGRLGKGGPVAGKEDEFDPEQGGS